MPAELKSTSHGQTMVLTLSNPEQRNALGPEMYAAGVEALNVAETSPEVRSVVITGAGAMFCAGGNLGRLQANRQQPPEVQAQSIEGLHTWIVHIPYGLFYFLLKVYALLSGKPPFTADQLKALSAGDEFHGVDTHATFGVAQTPFEDAVRESYCDARYSGIVLKR